MDNNISEKLSQILSDPQSMEKITAIAKSLGESGQTPPGAQASSGELGEMLRTLSSSPAMQAFFKGEKERIAFLNALKPYLADDKRDKLTSIIKALEGMDTINSISNLL